MRFRQFKFVEASRDWSKPAPKIERPDADITKIKKEYTELLSQMNDLGERARTKLLGKFSEKHKLQGMYDPQTGYFVSYKEGERGEIETTVSASGSMKGANELANLGLIPDTKMDQFKDQVTSADPDSKLQNKTLEILNKQLKATTDTEPTATQVPELTAATIKAEKKEAGVDGPSEKEKWLARSTDPNKLTAAQIKAGEKEAGGERCPNGGSGCDRR